MTHSPPESERTPAARPPAARPSAARRLRFSVAGMLLAMLVFCIMAAAASHLVRAVRGARSYQLAFVLFTLTAPVFLVVVVSTLQWLSRRMRGRDRKGKTSKRSKAR